jgi:hypothetical protein
MKLGRGSTLNAAKHDLVNNRLSKRLSTATHRCVRRDAHEISEVISSRILIVLGYRTATGVADRFRCSPKDPGRSKTLHRDIIVLPRILRRSWGARFARFVHAVVSPNR